MIAAELSSHPRQTMRVYVSGVIPLLHGCNHALLLLHLPCMGCEALIVATKTINSI